MARSSRDTMNKLLRTVYKDKLREQFSSKQLLLQEFPRENVGNFSEGDFISIPLHVALGSGFAFSSTGVLPAAGHQIVERATFNYKMLVDRIELAGDFMQDTSDGAAAERKILDFEVGGVAKAGRRGMAYHMYGDGTGKLAAVSSSGSATTLVVDSIRGILDNMRVDILLTADGTVGAGVQGAQVRLERATKKLTLINGAVLADSGELNSNAANYTVYRQGSRNDAYYGLEAWISDSNPPTGVANIGGLDRSLAVNDFYRAHVFSNGGTPREPDLQLIQYVLDEIDDAADSDVRLMICNPKVWNWIAFRLDNQKRFTHEKTTLRGWMSAIMFGDVPHAILKDPMCPPTKMFFMDPSLWRIWQINEGTWMDEDGAVLARVAGRVAYEAAWFRRMQVICLRPRSTAVLTDLMTELPS